MRWIELEIAVPATPAAAFPWVVEPGLLREWLPELEELRPRGFLHHRPVLRHGALRLGLDVHVDRVVVPELLALDVTWRGVVGRTCLEVEPRDDGSTVTWRVGVALPPALRLAGPGIARELRRVMRRNLELLAERLGEDHPAVDEHQDGGPDDGRGPEDEDATAIVLDHDDDAAVEPGPADPAAPRTPGRV